MNAKLRNVLCIVFCVVFLLGSFLVVSASMTGDADNKTNTDDKTSAETGVDSLLGEIKEGSVLDVPEVSGTTYYVDAASTTGNDGLTPETALKTLEEVNALTLLPGDQVLFKRDSIWNGCLLINNSGTESAPISYSAYGEGKNMPRLNGNGQVYATISGKDVSYVHIRNLEITNEGDRTEYLRGIFISAMHKDVNGIVIQKNYVHDVDSTDQKMQNNNASYNDYHWYGGIQVRARGGEKPDSKVKLDDILIDSNYVEDVSLVGITIGGSEDSVNKCTNVKVTNNVVSRTWGDGIILFDCDGGVIEGNLAKETVQMGDPTQYFVAIWIINCNNTLMQYNEVYGTGVGGDSTAFDVDMNCKDTTIQYNYSHDNHGGFLLMVDRWNGKCTVRYNISQNDGTCFLSMDFVRTEAGPYTSLDMYNNVFYTNQTMASAIRFRNTANMDGGRRLLAMFRNNIFYFAGASSNVIDGGMNQYVLFENNCWYGYAESALPVFEENRVVGDPKFKSVGTGKNGLGSLQGYQLLKDSPCLQTAVDIHNNGGIDFWGTKLGTSSNNIGVYYGTGVDPSKDTNLALSQPVSVSSVDALAIIKDMVVNQLVDGLTEKTICTEPSDDQSAVGWYEVDLGREYKIGKVVLNAGNDAKNFPENFTISVWDGKKWIETVSKTKYKVPEANGAEEFEFKQVKGSKIRIDFTKMRANEEGKYTAGLAEIEVYQK